MKRIRIELDTGYANAPAYTHLAYIYQGRNGSWHAASANGTPMALSNYAKNGMALSFALADAETADDALAAVRAHCYSRFANSARIYAGEAS